MIHADLCEHADFRFCKHIRRILASTHATFEQYIVSVVSRKIQKRNRRLNLEYSGTGKPIRLHCLDHRCNLCEQHRKFILCHIASVKLVPFQIRQNCRGNISSHMIPCSKQAFLYKRKNRALPVCPGDVQCPARILWIAESP